MCWAPEGGAVRPRVELHVWGFPKHYGAAGYSASQEYSLPPRGTKMILPNPKNNVGDLLYDTKGWLRQGYPIAVVCSQRIQSRVLGFLTVWISFNHLPRGPLKLLKESWLDQTNDSQSVITHISDVRERLKAANELAQKNLKSSQDKMKLWYDQNARARIFQPGDKVLVLSLLHGQPLQACYCGLYTVEQKVSKVNYAIKTPWQAEGKVAMSCENACYHSREQNSLPIRRLWIVWLRLISNSERWRGGEKSKADKFRVVVEFGQETDSFTCTGTESIERVCWPLLWFMLQMY